jgi:hypothetical protein
MGFTKLAMAGSAAGVIALLAVGTVTAQRKPAPRPAARPAAQQIVTGPKARYQMDVGTSSGMGGMSGGGGKPDMGQMMQMMRGGGGGDMHELRLRLGSTLAPTGGAPSADHYFQPPAQMGPSVPLVTPQVQPREDGTPGQFQRPQGRLLIFWGCGAHAPAGQPVIIDFSKLAAGQMPPDLFTTRVPVDHGPTPGNSRTYGDWPNPRSGRQPQGGTLLGQHRIAGNYSPEISFSLQQDYMAGLHVRTADGMDGSLSLAWNTVPTATGSYSWMMGAPWCGGRLRTVANLAAGCGTGSARRPSSGWSATVR